MSRALAKRATDILVPGYVPPLASFLRRRVVGKAGARMDWADVYREFACTGDWVSPPSPEAVAAALAYLCRAKGVRVEIDGRNVYCLDCVLL